MVAGEVIRRYASGSMTEEQEPQERHPQGEAAPAGQARVQAGTSRCRPPAVQRAGPLDLGTRCHFFQASAGRAGTHRARLHTAEGAPSPCPAGELPFDSNNCGQATDEDFIQLLAHAAASANSGAGPGSPRKAGKAAAGSKRGGKAGVAAGGGAMMTAAEMKRLQLVPDDVAKVRDIAIV